MSNSKHAHYRYNVLDKCFKRRQQPYSFKELLDEVNEKIAEVYPGESIQIRTLRSDIALFRDSENGFGAPLPVQRDMGKEVYCYSDPNFSIAQKKLLPYEQYLIDAAQQLLERYDEDPKYDKLSEALILFQEEEGATSIPNYDKILFYDKNEAYEGLSFLKPIFLAIKNKQVLKVTTEKFDGTDRRNFIFHPHILKQYNQRWYVFGFNDDLRMIHWVVPLDDRLKEFAIQKEIDYIEEDTDWENFFRQMVGPTRLSQTLDNPEPELVVLRFAEYRLPYFKSKPIHPYWDEFTGADKKNQVFFETIINLELIQQLLSYGKDVEVLEPESLKIKMQEHSQAMQKYYND
ncbi:MAG: WYL domain-containing protein [Flavobacteriales bacterium]|nr:WYL domain-containing protein [Flavobacteriales bacterium]